MCSTSPPSGSTSATNDRLLTTLKNLRDQGNTVIVVEHDEEAIREADYVFDIGPAQACTAGRWWPMARRAEIEANARQRDRRLSRRPAGDPGARDPAQGHEEES